MIHRQELAGSHDIVYDDARLAECRNYLELRGREIQHGGKAFTSNQRVALGERSVHRNGQLLESLNFQEGQAGATVCVPINLDSEPTSSVIKTLDLIDNNVSGAEDGVEVVLWFNSGYLNDKDFETATKVATSSYAQIKVDLEGRAFSNLSIKTALQMIPDKFRNMSQIRACYMDAMVHGYLTHNYDFNRPIIWMDVDTTFIAPDTISLLQDELISGGAIFAHANLQYSADFASGVTIGSLDLAAKAFIIAELARRGANRSPGVRRHNPINSGYVEEPGLGFLLSTYIKAGGIEVGVGCGQSGSLIYRTGTLNGRYDRVYPEKVNEWLFGADEAKADDTLFVSELSAARMGVSGRRLYVTARSLGADALLIGEDLPYMNPHQRAKYAGLIAEPIIREETIEELKLRFAGDLEPVVGDEQATEAFNRNRRAVLRLVNRLLP